MHEFVSVDLDWERYCNPVRKFATEDDYWDDHYAREAEMEAEAHEYAEMCCDLYEFDSEEERQAMYDAEFSARMKELEEEWTT